MLRRRAKSTLLAVLIVLSGASSAWFTEPAQASSGHASATARKAQAIESIFAGVPQSGIRLGSPSAPIVLYAFVDLLSPISAEYTSRVLPPIVARYVRRGAVRIELELLHFLGAWWQANTLARFAEATGEQGRLWNFAAEFFAHQRSESTPYATQQFIHSIAARVQGLDVPLADTVALEPPAQEELDHAGRLAKAHHIEGVPTVLIERAGRRPAYLGISTFREYEAVIERLLHPRSHQPTTGGASEAVRCARRRARGCVATTRHGLASASRSRRG